jgi:DNA-binding transcriptional MocR family regulator
VISPTWKNAPGPLADRLAAELRASISAGRIAAGSPLPSERDLASTALVSRTTVNAAIDQLVDTGWAVRRAQARSTATLPSSVVQPLASQMTESLDVIDLRPARLAAPVELTHNAIERARVRVTPYLLGSGRLPLGLPELRAAIAQRWTDEGLATTADQVVVTNGAMGAFQTCLAAIPGPVLVENPTYQNAIRILLQDRRQVAVWNREPTWNTKTLAATLRAKRPSLAYLVPDFHNPTGGLSTNEERAALSAIAGRFSDTTFVIDETLRDLDLGDGREPMPTPFGTYLERAITVGGLSKTMWSGLRVGWLRARTAGEARALAQFADVTPVPLFDQLVALEMWSCLDDLIAVRRARLRSQRDALVAECHTSGFTVALPAGGLACWVDLGLPIAMPVTERLGATGVLVSPGRTFSAIGGFDNFVRIPFTHEPEVSAAAVRSLAHLVATYDD